MKYVIAKYKEDVSWADHLDRFVVEKGKHIDNLGREASSYIWWIIENYHNLPDKVAFRQGNPFGHSPHFLDEDNRGKPYHWKELDIVGFAKELGITIPKNIRYIASAQFQVNRQELLKYPKEWYIKILKMSMEIEDAAWILERLWGYIWKVESWTQAIEPEHDGELKVICFTSNKYKPIFDLSWGTIRDKCAVEVFVAEDVENNTFGHEEYNKLCYDKAEFIYKTLLKMKENERLLFYDSDVLFFTDFKWFDLEGYDMKFQREGIAGGLNAGFVLMRNCREVRYLWEKVSGWRDYRFHDQDALNAIIRLTRLKYTHFKPKDVYTFGFVNGGQLYNGEKFYVSPEWKVFHGNYCVGIDNKIKLLGYVLEKRK